jgi:glycosyltransferase involved in cell wall biosynthesis
MSVRISVATAAWGLEFAQFVPGWWDAIRAMTRKPDQIVIGYENPDLASLSASVPDDLGIDILGFVLEPGGFTNYWNQVMRACNGDWIAVCCIDDRFLPDALVEVQAAEDAGAELLVDSIQWKYRGDVWTGYWDASVIGRVLTLPGAAPFRRSLFDRVGGFREDIYSSDWAFYMDAAKENVVTYQASTVRIVFDEGNAHDTRSGVRLDSDTRSSADAEIAEYARKIGLR